MYCREIACFSVPLPPGQQDNRKEEDKAKDKGKEWNKEKVEKTVYDQQPIDIVNVCNAYIPTCVCDVYVFVCNTDTYMCVNMWYAYQYYVQGCVYSLCVSADMYIFCMDIYVVCIVHLRRNRNEQKAFIFSTSNSFYVFIVSKQPSL